MAQIRPKWVYVPLFKGVWGRQGSNRGNHDSRLCVLCCLVRRVSLSGTVPCSREKIYTPPFKFTCPPLFHNPPPSPPLEAHFSLRGGGGDACGPVLAPTWDCQRYPVSLARLRLESKITRGNFKTVPWNRRPPQKGSIEPSRSFYWTPKKVRSSPKRFYRTPKKVPQRRFYRNLVRGTSEPQTGFYRTFRIEPPFSRLPF